MKIYKVVLTIYDHIIWNALCLSFVRVCVRHTVLAHSTCHLIELARWALYACSLFGIWLIALRTLFTITLLSRINKAFWTLPALRCSTVDRAPKSNSLNDNSGCGLKIGIILLKIWQYSNIQWVNSSRNNFTLKKHHIRSLLALDPILARIYITFKEGNSIYTNSKVFIFRKVFHIV